MTRNEAKGEILQRLAVFDFASPGNTKTAVCVLAAALVDAIFGMREDEPKEPPKPQPKPQYKVEAGCEVRDIYSKKTRTVAALVGRVIVYEHGGYDLMASHDKGELIVTTPAVVEKGDYILTPHGRTSVAGHPDPAMPNSVRLANGTWIPRHEITILMKAPKEEPDA